MKRFIAVILFPVLLSVLSSFIHAGGNYKNFKVAVYIRAYEVRDMNSLEKLKEQWNVVEKQVKVDKVYIETHRDLIVAEKEAIAGAKRFFENKGIRTAGGITLTVNERNRFETFCYSNPDHRKKVKEIVEYTAGLFDEIILDDFFFTDCKCDLCIKAKGNRSWTQFRLELLEEAARNLIIKPARAINPKVKMVIKYPNWYEHFRGLGFNLEAEPKLFDGIYTGTETRDAVAGGQHLQQYESYLISRYFENIKPGGNGGGWVDTGGMRYMDRYAEQLWLTLFARMPEITLFDIRQLQRPIRESDRAAWQGQQTSFDFDKMMEPLRQSDGSVSKPTTIARAAGYVFEQVDGFLGKLGKPVGVKSYKPYHSTGEDFLHNYLGMVGIPMDLTPEFPAGEKTIFLTEAAKFDNAIVDKIKRQLRDGKNVIITSGLLKALQGKGIEDIVELEYTNNKIRSKEFPARSNTLQSESEILIPQIRYLTNDAWELIGCITHNTGYPLLIQAGYSKGFLYVLVIPDDFGDLYKLPAAVLTQIKEVMMKDVFVRVDGPAYVSLFVYDNNTFIVESFLSNSTDIKIVMDKRFSKLRDALSGREMAGQASGDKIIYEVKIKPHSYLVFSAE